MISENNYNCQHLKNNEIPKEDKHQATTIETHFLITPETPTEAISSLNKPESAAIAAVRRHNNSPEAKALYEANKANGHGAQRNTEINAWRKDEGRQFHNEIKRAAYADTIRETEDRPVRSYEYHNTHENRAKARQEQNNAAQKKRREMLTPEEKKLENEKRAQRRQVAKARKAQALIDNSIF